MGWTECALGARDHIDETVGGEFITHRAWGTGYDSKVCWLIVDRPESDTNSAWNGIVAVLVKYGKWGNETTSCIKLVDESMGPVERDVPDKIWNNRPPLADDASDFAVEWRAEVEKFRATWTRKAVDLTEDDIGTEFRVSNYPGRTFTFTGHKRHRKSTLPTFDYMRIADWRNARVAVAEAVTEEAAA